jgi:hypothetical protein
MVLLVSGAALAAASSTSYKLTTEIFDSGYASASSASFKALYKAREKELTSASSASFIFGPGFLKSAYTYVKPAPLAPVVTAITPGSGNNTGPVNITNLAGANFQTGASVKLTKSGQTDIAATGVSVVSEGKITCAFDLTGAAAGAWDVVVTNPDGRAGTLSAAFTIGYAAPTVVSITPAKANNDATVEIADLAGTGFRAGATVKLSKQSESDITADNVVVVSSSRISCRFNVVNKTVGLWDVTVANADGLSATLPLGFKIEAPTVQIVGQLRSSLNPYNPASGGTSIDFTLSKDTNITVSIFNIRGEKVWERFYPAGQTGATAGQNSIPWDGMTDFRSRVSFGVYIVVVTSKADGSVKELARTKIAVVK